MSSIIESEAAYGGRIEEDEEEDDINDPCFDNMMVEPNSEEEEEEDDHDRSKRYGMEKDDEAEDKDDYGDCTYSSIFESDVHDTCIEIGEVMRVLCTEKRLKIDSRWTTPNMSPENVKRLSYIAETIFKLFHERLSPRKYKLEDGDFINAQPPAIMRILNDWSSIKNLTASTITLGVLEKFRETGSIRTKLVLFGIRSPELCNHPILGGILRALDVMVQRIEQSIELSADAASTLSMLERMPYENATLKTLPPGMVVADTLIGDLPPAMQATAWLRRKWAERGFAHIGGEVHASIQVQRVPGSNEAETEKVWMFTPGYKRIGTVEEVVRFECSTNDALTKLVGSKMKDVVGALSADGQTAFPNLIIMRNIWVACGRRSLDFAEARILHIWGFLKDEMQHMLRTKDNVYDWHHRESRKRIKIPLVDIATQIEKLVVCQQVWSYVDQCDRIQMFQDAQKLKKGANVLSDQSIINHVAEADKKMDHTFHPLIYPPYDNLEVSKSATEEEIKNACVKAFRKAETETGRKIVKEIREFLLDGFERSRYDNHMITKVENEKIPPLFRIAHDVATGIPREKIQYYSGPEDSNNVRIIQIGDNMKKIIRPKIFTMDEWNRNPPHTDPSTVIGCINWIGSMNHTRCAEVTSKGLQTMEDINNDENFVVVPTSLDSREFLVNDNGELLPSRGGRVLNANERPTDDMWKALFGWVQSHPAFEILNKVLGDQEFKLPTIVHFIAFAWGMHLYDQKFSLELFTMVWGVAGSGKTSCVADILSLILGPYMLQMRDNQGNDFAKGEMRDSSRFCMWLAEEKEDSHQNSKGSMMSVADILRHVSGVGSHNPVKHKQNFRFDQARQTLLTTGNNPPHTLFSSSTGGGANNRLAAMFRRIVAFHFPVNVEKRERNIQLDMKHWTPFFIMAASEAFQMFLVGSMGKEMKATAFFSDKVREWSSVGDDFPIVEALGLVIEKVDTNEEVTVGRVANKLKEMHNEGRLVNLESGMRETINRSSILSICDIIINLFSLDRLPGELSGMRLDQSVANKADKKNYKIRHAVLKKETFETTNHSRGSERPQFLAINQNGCS